MGYVWSFVIHCDKTPVGYIQYYAYEKAPSGDESYQKFPDPVGLYGIDLFIINPDPENIAAVRCYEKAGFKKVTEIRAPHGSEIIMEFAAGNLRGDIYYVTSANLRHLYSSLSASIT